MKLDTKNSKKPRPHRLARTSLTGKGFVCQMTRFFVPCENKGGKIDPSHSSSSCKLYLCSLASLMGDGVMLDIPSQ